jgi:tRNA(Leu) C34 or U34 (ribose-2'-O)-methylase TrmL
LNKLKFNSNIIILIDSIKDSRDLAELIQLSLATGVKLCLTGDSIKYSSFKVLNILNSWNLNFADDIVFENIEYFSDYFLKVENLKKENYKLIGTSPNITNSLFVKDYSKNKVVFVFGTEYGGLSKKKMSVLDEIVSIPMKNNIPFFTLKTVVPVVTYEILRQKELV